ncbi:hypothetical protein RSO68_11045 [Halomonas saccharevitans]|uniref:Uncharacterized protein n=1 Tax=Halomonas saccharevitans TaxID=416872 RepID=A0ABU3NFR4_9GAMM|nr:hypothetical protein [Halomonas saccharevitans]MDT8880014.1 hypothetical protein [Halomonas saccharevitans]
MTPAPYPTLRCLDDAPRRDGACEGARVGEAELQGFQGWYGYWFITGVPVAMS